MAETEQTDEVRDLAAKAACTYYWDETPTSHESMYRSEGHVWRGVVDVVTAVLRQRKHSTESVPTLNSKLSSAELCRRNGWAVGTRLVGDEGYGPTTITITAIGDEHILARSDHQLMDHETTWTLHCRDWKVAP